MDARVVSDQLTLVELHDANLISMCALSILLSYSAIQL